MHFIVFYSFYNCNQYRSRKQKCAELIPMDVPLHPREGGKDLILNARSIRFEKKEDRASRINYAIDFFTDASGKLNPVVASMDRICWLSIRKENGFARRRRRRAWRELDPTSDWPVDSTTFSRMPLLSRSLGNLCFFSSSAATWKGAIAVKRLRRNGLINNTYHICIELSLREATRRHFPSIINSPTRIENYRSENLRFESFFS